MVAWRALPRRLFVGSGLQTLRERFSARALVLVYHGLGRNEPGAADSGFLSIARFREHLQFYSRRRKVVSLQELFEGLREGRTPDPRLLAITFDDAFAETCQLAAELLASFQMPWALGVPVGLVNRPGTLWNQELRLAVLNFGAAAAPGHSIEELADLSSDDATRRLQAANRMIHRLLHGHPEERLRVLEAMRNAVPAERLAELLSSNPQFGIVSSSALGELSRSGVEIGAHGWSHQPLNEHADADLLQLEVHEARRRLEAMLQLPVRFFAFPYGIASPAARDAVAAAGYPIALTSEHRAVTSLAPGTPAFLPRVAGEWPLSNLRMILSSVR